MNNTVVESLSKLEKDLLQLAIDLLHENVLYAYFDEKLPERSDAVFSLYRKLERLF